jgi:hypothetical protein
MHPFTAILGIVAGSLVSLAFGLAVVLLVFWLLQNDNPRFSAELPEVARGFFMFFWLAIFSVVAFVGTIRGRRWRFAPLTLMWIGLLGAGWYYWPS